MKLVKWAFAIWLVSITLVGILAVKVSRSNTRTETSLFCAYNRIFVEFEEDGKRWGTLMLDYNGRPIPCDEEEKVKVENTI